MKYKWILSSKPCTICMALSTQVYTQKPQRPHKFCKCTFVKIEGEGGQDCKTVGVDIVELNRINVEADYEMMGVLDYTDKTLLHEWEVVGLCPDGSKVTAYVTVEFEGEDLQKRMNKLDNEWAVDSSGDKNISSWNQDSSMEAAQKAMSILEMNCPECAPKKDV